MSVFKRILGAWILWRMFGPELAPKFSDPQVHPMQITGRTVFVHGREIFVREAGPEDGPPLVLVHGWGDPVNVVFARILPALATRFRVIAIDNRDAGKSDLVRAAYAIEEVADDVAGVMQELGLGACPVFGYSMGGMIVQELIHRHPHFVEKLGLAGTAAHVSLGVPGANVLRPVGLVIARAFERFSRSEVSYARTKYLLKVGAIAPEEARHFWLQSIGRDPEVYWMAGQAASQFDSTSWVGDIDVPTLVVVNTADQLVPPASQYDLAGRVKDATVVELVAARHESPLTHHREMVDAITRWMDS